MRLIDTVGVAQIPGIDERDRRDARIEAVDLFAQQFGVFAVAFALGLEFRQCLFGLAQCAPRAGPHREPSADGLFHRAHHVQAGRVAVAGEAGAHALDLWGGGKLLFDQVGQGEVFEEVVEELVFA